MYTNYSRSFYKKSRKLSDFLKCDYDGVFYIGHASILVRLSNKKYIFDAIEQSDFYNNSWCFFPSQIMDTRLLDIDGAFVSHVHQDHYDPSFLKKLQKKNVPIYILNGRTNFNNLLKKEKIKFNLIPDRKKFYINKNTWVYGCLHEYNDIDSSMVISNNNLSVYHGNDNFITEKSLIPFKKSVGDVDVGCIPFAFIHYYPYLLDGISKRQMSKEGSRLENQFMDYGIMQSKILKPKLIIPFGSNLFHSDNPNSSMNRAVATPVDFVDYAKKKHSNYSKNYKTMLSGSYCFKINGKISSYYEDVSSKKFNYELKKFINNKKKSKKKSSSVRTLPIKQRHLRQITTKIKRNKNKLDHKIVIESNNSQNNKILINLNNNQVSIYKKKILPNNSHYFKVEPNEFNQWLKGKLTFEEVLGTRRFRYTRKPNIYEVKIMQVYTNYL